MNVDSLSDDSSDLIAFILNAVFDEGLMTGRIFSDPQKALDSLNEQYDLEAMAVISANGGGGFEKLVKLSEADPRFDKSKFVKITRHRVKPPTHRGPGGG